MNIIDIDLSTPTIIFEFETGITGPACKQGPQGVQGVQGPQGEKGNDGLGVPPGGVKGAVLTKISSDDNDTLWEELDRVKISLNEPINKEKVWLQLSKNLFNKNNIINNSSYVNDGTKVYLIGAFIQESYIPVESSTNYIFSTASSLASVENGRTVIMEYDGNYNFIKRNLAAYSGTLVITTASNTKYVRLGGSSIGLETYQFEKGSTRTNYEEYAIKKMHSSNNGIYEKFTDTLAVNPIQPNGQTIWVQKSNNLFKLEDKSSVVNGVTFNAENQILTIKGTATADIQAFYITMGITLEEISTLSCTISGSGTEYIKPKLAYKRNGTSYYPDVHNQTFEAGDYLTQFYFIISSGATVDLTVKLQLEKGNKKTEWQPAVDKKMYAANENGIYEELLDIEALLLKQIEPAFNNDYVYSTDRDYVCFKMGKMVILNINSIAFSQAITSSIDVITGLPAPSKDIIFFMHGGREAKGTASRFLLKTSGVIRLHYDTPPSSGDASNIQYGCTLIYEAKN